MRGGEEQRGRKGDNSTVGTRGPVPGRYFGNRRPIINRKSRKPLTSETVRRLYAGYVAANHTLCRSQSRGRGRGRAPSNRLSCLTKKIIRCVNFEPALQSAREITVSTLTLHMYIYNINSSCATRNYRIRGKEHETLAMFNPVCKKCTD